MRGGIAWGNMLIGAFLGLTGFTVLVIVVCALYCIGENLVETAYEKYYGAQDWEKKWQERKEKIKDMLKLIGFMLLFGAGMFFVKYAADWFVASVYRLGAGG